MEFCEYQQAMMAHVRRQHACATWGHGASAAAPMQPPGRVIAAPSNTFGQVTSATGDAVEKTIATEEHVPAGESPLP